MLNSIKILGVKITSEAEDKVLEYVFKRLRNGSKKLFIVTPNPEILTYAYSHLDYQNKLNEAEVNLPDGVGILLAAKLMGKSIKERITGTDFIEKLCLASGENPISMGFLGGKRGVAEKTAQCLKKKYPWIEIGFAGQDWGDRRGSAFAKASADRPAAPATPHSSGEIDLLFVALGAPKQEEWIYENLEKLPVKAAMGVGGAFDYISGEVMRAPKFIRAIGFEWLFRLILEPWRIKRQVALIKFIYLVLKEKFLAK